MNEVEDFYQLDEANKMVTFHSWKTLAGLAIIAVIGALQALQGHNLGAWLDVGLSLALALEHIVAGKTE